MADMNPKRHPMPTQDPAQRARNFSEVALGYDADTAVAEALRCLGCKNRPCVSGCPVNVRIPEFIDKIKEGRNCKEISLRHIEKRKTGKPRPVESSGLMEESSC